MFHSTTILAVRCKNLIVFSGDGQVSMGQSIIKANAKKLRKLSNGKILAGFAGSTSDAFILFDKFEKKIKEYDGQFLRSAVELAKDWRSDKILRKLEALLLVADAEKMLIISGSGDVIEPDGDVCAIGSGGMFALSAARALLENTDISARLVAKKAMEIASDICVYTNKNISLRELTR